MSTRHRGAVTKCRIDYYVLSPPFRSPALAFFFLHLAPRLSMGDVIVMGYHGAGAKGLVPSEVDR